jgi:hypothetical protein
MKRYELGQLEGEIIFEAIKLMRKNDDDKNVAREQLQIIEKILQDNEIEE